MGNEASALSIPPEFIGNHHARTQSFAKSELAAFYRAVKANTKKDDEGSDSDQPPCTTEEEESSLTTRERSLSDFARLAEELFLLVCSFIDDPRTLCAIGGVCRVWRRISSDALLWRQQYVDKWGEDSAVRARAAYPEIVWKKIYGSEHKLQRCWTTGSNVVTTLQGHTGTVTSLQFNETTLMSGDDTGNIQVWDLASGQKLHPFNGHSGPVWCLRFNDTYLASGSYDKTIKIWDLDSWRCTRTLRGHDGWVSCLALISNRVVSGSWDETVKIWDPNASQLMTTLHSTFGSIYSLQATDSTMVCGSRDQAIQLWDLPSATCTGILTGHTASIYGVQMRSDENEVISCSDDKTIRLWDTRTNTCTGTLLGHKAGVMCVQADDNKVVSGSYDHRVNLWDKRRIKGICQDTDKSGPYLYSLYAHGDPVFCLQFDETKIVTGSSDMTLKIFDFGGVRHDVDEEEKIDGFRMNGRRCDLNVLTKAHRS